MKYRITTNGLHFRIQKRGFFGWATRHDFCGFSFQWSSSLGVCSPTEFMTEEGCENHMKECYGTSAKRVRGWRAA